ncbi:MAG: Respiratory-chain NADH dehydrogenase 24 Kd subunit [Tenericutes bacterium ADurb.BinA155]|jgi:NADH:ubiquinone oxidoreductase subunit E|nr:MAG: Respiratory-chain NADH dehydrogenase 24 Kd subunit [Tenericutes bacterium ADurb.BinA155]
MLALSICVGSSCHLKGSYDVIELFRKEITARKLEGKIELKAAFCLGKCGCDGVSIKVGDKIVTGVNPTTFKAIFEREVLPLVA